MVIVYHCDVIILEKRLDGNTGGENDWEERQKQKTRIIMPVTIDYKSGSPPINWHASAPAYFINHRRNIWQRRCGSRGSSDAVDGHWHWCLVGR
jgi:hypothetical protein